MKIVIIGGAGARVPLLTNGLLRFHEELKTSELALWDINSSRRESTALISAAMAQRFGVPLKVSTPDRLEGALQGADFVISSIRVGGIAGRIQDETIALKHGTLGQETVGAGGFALALRTIPVMVEYAEKVARLAPEAWLLNFSNPVGIVSQAMIKAGWGDRTIGICDTPREQFESLAHALDVNFETTYFDYLGLNHLGWIRAILVNGKDRIDQLLDSPEKLSTIYRLPFFSEDFLRRLRLFPTEYLYFYYSPEEARDKTAAGGRTRGQLIQRLDEELAKASQQSRHDPAGMLEAYDHYLASRNATYMAVETGAEVSKEKIAEARSNLYRSAAGYDRIAIDVMRAIRTNQPAVMPLDVANRGAIADFEDDDAIEVPCAIDANGAHPLSAGRLPGQVRELALRVKEYERLTVEAALQESAALAEDALAANPILKSRQQCRAILEEYRAAHAPHLDYLAG